jgi:hypothetical protein
MQCPVYACGKYWVMFHLFDDLTISIMESMIYNATAQGQIRVFLLEFGKHAKPEISVDSISRRGIPQIRF